MKREFIIAVLLVSIVFNSCYYDVESELYPTSADCSSTDITYNGRIKGIIADNCLIGCHQGATPSANLALDTYTLVQTIALNGKLMDSLRGTNGLSIMPKNTSGLLQCEIAAVQDWVNAGSAEN